MSDLELARASLDAATDLLKLGTPEAALLASAHAQVALARIALDDIATGVRVVEPPTTFAGFATLTLVMRGEDYVTDQLDEILPLPIDDIMFWASEPGVTKHALEQGADPKLWTDG